jgi:site-specific DNA-methyltransferase (adenine-specific)
MTTPRPSNDAEELPNLLAPAPPPARLLHGDNLAAMATLPAASCDLIYVDPPFMSGTIRRSEADPSGFDDRWTGGLDAFLAFLQPRLVEMHRLLAESGTLYVHLDPRTSHYVKVALDRIFGYENFLNEVIWSYRTGGVSTQWFARKHDVLLAYAKKIDRHTFNVLRSGTFRTDGLKLDETGRPYKSTRTGRLYFNADGPALTDVWEIPFLSTVALERTGYPTQKPEALLERVIAASSNPLDLVADFFCGSGTTLAVARRLGRRALGCDSSAEALEIARGRLGADVTVEPVSS